MCLGISCTNSSIPPSTWRDQAGDPLPLINAELLWDLQSWHCLSCLCPTFLSWAGLLAQLFMECWKCFFYFLPIIMRSQRARPSWEVLPTQSQVWEQQWGRSGAEGHERESFRHQNKFLNNSTDQRLAAGIQQLCKSLSQTLKFQLGFPYQH